MGNGEGLWVEKKESAPCSLPGHFLRPTSGKNQHCRHIVLHVCNMPGRNRKQGLIEAPYRSRDKNIYWHGCLGLDIVSTALARTGNHIANYIRGLEERF